MSSSTSPDVLRIRALLATGAGAVLSILLIEIFWRDVPLFPAGLVRILQLLLLAVAAVTCARDTARAQGSFVAVLVANQFLAAISFAFNGAPQPLIMMTTGCLVVIAALIDLSTRQTAGLAMSGFLLAALAFAGAGTVAPSQAALGILVTFTMAVGSLVIRYRLRQSAARSERHESAWRSSQSELDLLIDRTPSLVQRVDASGRLAYANPAWLTALGYAWPEVWNRPVWQFLHPDDHAHCQEIFARLNCGTPVDRIECRFVARDGSTVWAEGSAVPPRRGGEFPATTLAVFHDVSARVAMVEDLRRAHEFLRRLIDSIPTRVAVLDDTMGILQANRAWRAPAQGPHGADPLWALREGDNLLEVVSRAAAAAVDLQPAADLLGAAQRGPDHQGSAVITSRAADGSPVWWQVEIASFPYADRRFFVLTQTDLTPIQTAENAILASQARFDRAVSAAQQGILEWDIASSEIYYGPALLDALGLDQESLQREIGAWVAGTFGDAAPGLLAAIEWDVSGATFRLKVPREFPNLTPDEPRVGLGYWQSIVHPEDQGAVFAALAQHYAGTAPVVDIEVRIRHQSGGFRWFHLRARGCFAADGSVERVTGSLIDVTERREAAAALEAIAEQLRTMVETAPLGIVTIDEAGLVTQFNPAASRIFGIDAGSAIGQPAAALTPRAARDGLGGFLAAIFAQPVGKSVASEIVLHDPDGAPIDTEVVAILAASPSGRRVHAFLRDVSEEKRVGRLKDEMISTLSHELRTPLTSLRGFAELLATQEFGRDVQLRYISIIRKETERMTRLVNGLLDMRRAGFGPQTGSLTATAPASLVADAVARLPVEWRQHRRIVVDADAELPRIVGDADTLGRVLDNVLSNACKYSDPTASIRITLRDVGAKVRCAVSDEGIGIPPGDLARLFDEFFRGDSSRVLATAGTGLGLSICRKILEGLGGTIAADSMPGKGTTITIEIPKFAGTRPQEPIEAQTTALHPGADNGTQR
jgi:PAS domain S-box-containing protein